VQMPNGRWQATCPTCHQHFHRHRRPRRITGWYCRDCGPTAGQLRWSEQPICSEKPNGN
jgi:ribosomal protein L37AE/L43A